MKLIDGDILIYRAVGAATNTYYELYDGETLVETVPSGEHSSGQQGGVYARKLAEAKGYRREKVQEMAPFSHIVHTIRLILEKIDEEISGPSTLFITDGLVFRKALYPEYKAHRPEPPPQVEEAKRYLVEEYRAQVGDFIEADDCITMYKYHSPNSIIVSSDKDFFQVKGRIFNPTTGKKYKVGKKGALKAFWHQMLTGDFADNIPGLKGFGKLKSEKVLKGLDTEHQLSNTVFSIYISELDMEGMYQFLLNYKLLKLLRTREEMAEIPEFPFLENYDKEKVVAFSSLLKNLYLDAAPISSTGTLNND